MTRLVFAVTEVVRLKRGVAAQRSGRMVREDP
jgi:hypothetical protein